MKTKDLMVGDWVMHGKKKRKCYNICGHTNDVMLDNGVFTNVMNINPMPLTLEILEKNGFRVVFEGELHVCYFQDIGRFHVEIKVDKVGIFQKLSMCDGFGNKVTIIECRFVHQLQHAMRICGIEKEIIV